MFKKKSALAILILVGALAISAASIIALSHQIQPTPLDLVTQEQAAHIAFSIAQTWNDPNAQVLTGRKLSRSDYLNELKAQGEDVLVAGTGDVWIVNLRGNFTPHRVRLGAVVKCTEMSVAIVVENGDVISVTCR